MPKFAALVKILAATLAAVGSLAATAGPELAAGEYRIKAAFIYNFTKFVEWPSSSFASEDSPIVIGVIGENPFGSELENIAREKRTGGRQIEVIQIDGSAQAAKCHIVFVSALAEKADARMLEGLKGSNILTVGESERFARDGGVVRFLVEDGKVRFEINADAAEKAGLKISAQLQKVAKTIWHRT